METVSFDLRLGDEPFVFPEEATAIDISTSQTRISRSYLHTKAVSTCIGFVAHNSVSRTGLMSHLTAAATTDREVFESALHDLSMIGETDTTELYLIGGAPEDVYGLSRVQEDRDFTLMRAATYLADLSLPKELLKVNWTEDRSIVDLTLDCRFGDLMIERQEAYEY